MTNKRGRPSKYKPSMCEDLVDRMSDGALDCEIYAAWNISKDTFYRWLNEYPEFKEAYEIGLPKCETWWIGNFRRLLSGELDGKHSFNAAMAIANNKFKWSRGTGQDTATQININNMNVLQHQSKDELMQYIQTKLQELEIINEPEFKFIESSEQKPS